MKTGTVSNLVRAHRDLLDNGMMGLLWGDASVDCRNSHKKPLSVILLKGDYVDIGVDLYVKSRYGYKNSNNRLIPIEILNVPKRSGLFYSKFITNKYYGKFRETIPNYLKECIVKPSDVRILPNRKISKSGIVEIKPNDLSIVGKLPQLHPMDGLFFKTSRDVYIYVRDNIRWFSRIKGTVRTGTGEMSFNHWKVGPLSSG